MTIANSANPEALPRAEDFRFLLRIRVMRHKSGIEGSFELIVLDVMLPDKKDLASQDIRQRARTPVLMLTARAKSLTASSVGARRRRLPGEAVQPRELAARISAFSADRAGNPTTKRLRPPKIKFGDLELDLGARIVSKPGGSLNLTSAEFELLHMFFEFPGQVLTRISWWNVSWIGNFPLDRSIDFHITNLRRKLGPQPDGGERIRSIRGIGYLYAWPGKQ